MTKAKSLRTDFARAVGRLDEAFAFPEDPIVPDYVYSRLADTARRFRAVLAATEALGPAVGVHLLPFAGLAHPLLVGRAARGASLTKRSARSQPTAAKAST